MEMLQHDITNDKYYEDGVEITQAEYDQKYQEWLDNLPEPPEPIPVEDIVEADELVEIILGGAS